MLIPSTIIARRTRRYTTALYIHGTTRRVGYCSLYLGFGV